jgi:hypothetical protein
MMQSCKAAVSAAAAAPRGRRKQRGSTHLIGGRARTRRVSEIKSHLGCFLGQGSQEGWGPKSGTTQAAFLKTRGLPHVARGESLRQAQQQAFSLNLKTPPVRWEISIPRRRTMEVGAARGKPTTGTRFFSLSGADQTYLHLRSTFQRISMSESKTKLLLARWNY